GCRRTGKSATAIRCGWRRVLWTRSCSGARPTRPAVGASWGRPKAMAAASKTTMSNMAGPRRCGSKNSSPTLGAACGPNTCRYPPPSKATSGRVLRAVDPLRVEEALLAWQTQVRGPAPPEDLLAADGKALRHAQGAQIVTLTHPASQYYRGSQLVERKSNEIPAVRQLLARVDVTGCL